ncbi:phosphonate C-P lyase system protein PhnH [Stappia sp. TSB10GB4]|uniref:phosphonate C-P lyase system protein PhnH n=1 Tax=Stappia sp. TSB10GB4 TaxID=2003584 RepID=UPI00164832C1|nr:phosphonate C-P lyase system protein PhnH [Stappia sp. TSB10GB4]
MSDARLSTLAVSGGFSDPVFEAQAVFRALMDATARPGTVHTLPTGVAPPAPLGQGPGAVALALCDPDTPVWLDRDIDSESVRAWLSFQCGAPLAQGPERSAFAFVKGETMPDMADFASGTQEYPDRSTTLVVEVEALDGGAALRLEGPGIDGQRRIAPRGLPATFMTQRAANRALFPRGVDVVLVAGLCMMALPRSTVVSHVNEPEAG